MPYYSVLDVTLTSDQWAAGYVGPVTALVAEHGGRYLARTFNHEQLEGNAQNDGTRQVLRVIIEWPSKTAAANFMDDPRYAPHLAARAAGSVSNHYLIAGKDDLT